VSFRGKRRRYRESCVNSFRPQLNCGQTGNLHTTRHTAQKAEESLLRGRDTSTCACAQGGQVFLLFRRQLLLSFRRQLDCRQLCGKASMGYKIHCLPQFFSQVFRDDMPHPRVDVELVRQARILESLHHFLLIRDRDDFFSFHKNTSDAS